MVYEPCANSDYDPKDYADKSCKATLRINVFFERFAKQVAWATNQKLQDNFEEKIAYEAQGPT